jgi:hypothetical protein
LDNRNQVFLVMMAVPWLARLVTGLSRRRPGLAPRSVREGFVVALIQVFPELLPCEYNSSVAVHIHKEPG